MNKKMNFKYAIMAAALTLGFASCSNDDNNPIGGPTEEGPETKMGLSFTIPTIDGTRAADGDQITATGDESNIKSIRVFIFEPTTGAAATGNNTTFSNISEDFTKNESTGTYTLKESRRIKTTAGNRTIYVAANLPAAFPEPATLSVLKEQFATVANATSVSAGYIMCSPAIAQTLNYQEEGTSPTVNNVSAALERIVAKVTVTSANSFTQKFNSSFGGLELVYTIEKWGLGQDANESFVAQHLTVDATSGRDILVTRETSRNGFPLIGGMMNVNGTSYIDNWTNPGLISKYIGENGPASKLQGEATYVMVQTKVRPNKKAVINGTSGNVEWVNAETSDYATLWVVRDKDGKIYFCSNQTDADAVAQKVADELKGNSTKYEYIGGRSYFLVYLNATKDKKEVNVYRNQFVHVNVTGVKDDTFTGIPGKGTDGTTPPDPEDEDNPDPVDPNIPVVETNAYLLVDVVVKKWALSTTNVILQ